jgi:hypothetical protein
MNSPSPKGYPKSDSDFISPDRFITQLDCGLLAAIQSREDATPEAQPPPDQNFQSYCELKREHFTSSQAEKLRRSIRDTQYWKCEANHFRLAVEKYLDDDNNNNTEAWRRAAEAFEKLHVRLGKATKEVKEYRQRIGDPSYWRVEGERYEQESHRRESKLRQRWANAHNQRRQNPQQSQQGQGLPQIRRPDRVSARTRSKMRSEACRQDPA